MESNIGIMSLVSKDLEYRESDAEEEQVTRSKISEGGAAFMWEIRGARASRREDVARVRSVGLCAFLGLLAETSSRS